MLLSIAGASFAGAVVCSAVLCSSSETGWAFVGLIRFSSLISSLRARQL